MVFVAMAMERTRRPKTWEEVDEVELERAAHELAHIVRGESTAETQDDAEEGKNEGRNWTIFQGEGNPRTQVEPRWCKDPLGWGWIDGMRGILCEEKEEDVVEDDEPSTPNDTNQSMLLPRPAGTERRSNRTEPNTKKNEIRPNCSEFDPVAYLTFVHRNTSLEQLEQGMKVLQEELSERKGQLKALVKDNFERFISCKKTIDHLHARMKYLEDGTENLASTASLKVSLEQLNAQSKRIFGPMLERQDQIQRIKKVLDLLGRYKSLLGLPKQFREYVRKGEHTKIIAEYNRAKGVISKTSMGILHKLLGELQKMLKDMVRNMYETLENPNLSVEEAEGIVKHLLELRGMESNLWEDYDPSKRDPVGHYLQLLHARITDLFKTCTSNYMERMAALEEELQEHAEAENRWRELHGDVDLSARATDSAVSPNTEQRTPITRDLEDRGMLLSLRLVRKLCAVAAANIPFFCSLPSTFHESEAQSGRSLVTDKEEFNALALDLFDCFSVSVKDAYNDFIRRTLTIKTLTQSIIEFLQTTQTIQQDPSTALGKDAIGALRTELLDRFFWYLQKSVDRETEQLISNASWAPEHLSFRRSVFEVSAEKYGTLLPENTVELERVLLMHLDKIKSLAGSCSGDASTVAALWAASSPILFQCLSTYLDAVLAVVSIPSTTDTELAGCLCAMHFLQEHVAASLLRVVEASQVEQTVAPLHEFASALEEFCAKVQEVESKAAKALMDRHFVDLSRVVSTYMQGLDTLQERDVGIVRSEALDVLEYLISFRASMLRLPDSFTRKIMPLFVTEVLDTLVSSAARAKREKGTARKQLAFEVQYFLKVLNVYIEDSVQQKCVQLINDTNIPEDQLGQLVRDGIAKTRVMTLCFASSPNE